MEVPPLIKTKIRFLDAKTRGNVARFINNSCDPNCLLDKPIVNGYLRLVFVANKDIPKGTELTFKYDGYRGVFVCICETCLRKKEAKMSICQSLLYSSG